MVASKNLPSLEIAFDVGHSSIGWAVLGINKGTPLPDVLGCGAVIFEKDSALANSRRLHRQQRRHVRATRQRIARIERLLAHLGVLSPEQLTAKHRAAGGHSAPWLLAARVLASNGQRTLTWTELWDVLRWYAHNRGYDQIGGEQESATEDTEKVENAKREMADFGKATMAETICAWLGLDPLGDKAASLENYKAKNCAFERSVIAAEVASILNAHCGKLPGVDDALVTALLRDARAIAVPSIKLPRRYTGSLLFGRLATRYHNRIIGRCPISGTKIPGKNCPEFLHFRFAMLLANIRVASQGDAQLRRLNVAERKTLYERALAPDFLHQQNFARLCVRLPKPCVTISIRCSWTPQPRKICSLIQ
jgi:hypothetical protein